MTQDRVMLLIDADNVSIDIVEQSVALLLERHGALHVRRAYGTAESAVKNQAAWKRLSIKPMVNLATGKNSTDIALAVDAMDLVLAERPDVVAIASSDSDFAPLVSRLREKGCRVIGLGQDGKTGEETIGVYDEFTVLTHRKAAAADESRPRAARKTARAPARKATATAAGARAGSAAKSPRKEAPAPAAPRATPSAARNATKTVARTAATTAGGVAVKAPAAARKAAPRRKTAALSSEPAAEGFAPSAETVGSPAATPLPELEPVRQEMQGMQEPQDRQDRQQRQGSRALRTQPQQEPQKLQQILASLPELGRGSTVELRVASQRLREVGLLSRSGSCTRLFGQFGEHFELLPAGQPNHVRMRI